MRVALYFSFAMIFGLVSCRSGGTGPLLYKFLPGIDSVKVSPNVVQFSPADGNRDTTLTFTVEAFMETDDATTFEGVFDLFVSVRSVTKDAIVHYPSKLTPSAAGGYAADVPVKVNTTANETLMFVISQHAQAYGNNVSWHVTREIRANPGQPPVILEVMFPDTVRKPSIGSITVLFRARVSDPDGISNIERVEFTIFDLNGNPVAASQRMFDDGLPSSGDAVAGDGIFTRALSIDATNTARTLRLRFIATDRTGLQSPTVERLFTILE